MTKSFLFFLLLSIFSEASHASFLKSWLGNKEDTEFKKALTDFNNSLISAVHEHLILKKLYHVKTPQYGIWTIREDLSELNNSYEEVCLYTQAKNKARGNYLSHHEGRVQDTINSLIIQVQNSNSSARTMNRVNQEKLGQIIQLYSLQSSNGKYDQAIISKNLWLMAVYFDAQGQIFGTEGLDQLNKSYKADKKNFYTYCLIAQDQYVKNKNQKIVPTPLLDELLWIKNYNASEKVHKSTSNKS